MLWQSIAPFLGIESENESNTTENINGLDYPLFRLNERKCQKKKQQQQLFLHSG